MTHKRANTPTGPETASSVMTRPTSLSEEASNQSLDVRILGTLQTIPGHGEKKGFFPEKTLVNLIDQESIREQLEQCSMDLSPRVIERWSQRICGLGKEHLSFKKVFTLLVLMDKAADIPLFLEESVSDDKLPLQRLPRKEENIFDLAFKPNTMDCKVSPLQCFRGWKPAAIRNFEEWQWSTSAAFFPRGQYKDVPHFNFEDERPLPFTKDSRFNWGPAQERLEYDGGFSSVFKVQIHPEHHDLHGFHDNSPLSAFKDTGKQCLSGSDSSCHQDQTQKFAIKRLLSHDEEEFKREADTLKRFSDGSYLHLVSLLATYQQYKRYYLVFPCARGDLKEYWSKQNPQPETDIDTVQWVAKQCRGIAEGLGQIHRYVSKYSKEAGVPTEELYGKHGDIKPQNILWFNDRHHRKGILKITDFGLAEFKTSLSTFCRPQTRMVVSPSYRAPECDLSNGVGRSSDIWALGCVYLEMITWLLGGRILMEEFFKVRLAIDPHWENMRTDAFFECIPDADSPSAQLKSTVKEVCGHSLLMSFTKHSMLLLTKLLSSSIRSFVLMNGVQSIQETFWISLRHIC